MRRLLVSIINWIICIIIAIVLRGIIAIPHRIILVLARPIKINNPMDLFPIHLNLLLPFFISCIYYLGVIKFRKGVTFGEQICGIRIETQWIIWYALLEGITVIFLPVTVIFYCFTKKMPYDKCLKVEVEYIKFHKNLHSANTCKFGHQHKFACEKSIFHTYINKKIFRVLSFLVIILMLINSIIYFNFNKKIFLFDYVLKPIHFSNSINFIANVYSGNIELNYIFLEERVISNIKQKESYVFTDSEIENGLAFVSTSEKHFNDYYGVYGLDLKNIDFKEESMVITYGRKLSKALMIAGMDIPMDEEEIMEGPRDRLYLVLDEEFKDNTIYFYKLPKFYLEKNIDVDALNKYDICHAERLGNKSYTKVNWLETDYEMYIQFPYSSIFPYVEQSKKFSRWIWSYQWFRKYYSVNERGYL